MRRSSHLILFLLCLFFAAICAAETPPDKRVLFIGNSFSSLNGGVDSALASLVPGLIVERVTPNGYTLDSHFKDRKTLARIREGKWDFVILQDQSQNPIFNYPKFSDSAEKLAAVIREAGAKPALFMTWERPDSAAEGVTYQNLAGAYQRLAQKLGVLLIPAGSAFQTAQREGPHIILTSKDGHPTSLGTYLAACVSVVSILGKDVTMQDNNKFIESADDRAFLQGIARRIH